MTAAAAAYNPESLDRIRKGATAHELGWDDETYRARCRRHQIAPTTYSPRIPVLSEIADVAPIVPEPPPPKSKPEPADGPCTFILASRLLDRGGHTIALPRRQSEAFVFIAKATKENPANGRSIAERMGIDTHGGIGGHVKAPRERLVPLNLDITTRHNREFSGYWLTDSRSGETVKTKVLA